MTVVLAATVRPLLKTILLPSVPEKPMPNVPEIVIAAEASELTLTLQSESQQRPCDPSRCR